MALEAKRSFRRGKNKLGKEMVIIHRYITFNIQQLVAWEYTDKEI